MPRHSTLLLSAALLTTLVAPQSIALAQAAHPAPMNGIWSLTTSSLHGNVQQPEGPTQVFIVNGELRGNLGCGPFTGKLQADLGRVQLTATTPVPSIGGCTELHAALKGVNRYVISRDTQRLVLLSPDTQLHFKRIGYVTPAKK